MTTNGIVQILMFFGVLIALAWPLGLYMARVYEGKSLFGLDRALGPLERLTYRLCGVRASDEMNWKSYAVAVLLFNLLARWRCTRFSGCKGFSRSIHSIWGPSAAICRSTRP